MNDMEKMLIHRCKKGDLAAFEILIFRYQKKTYNIALGMVGNIEDAKDVAQDSLIKAFQNIKTFKGKSKFSTWLYRITINTSKDFLRKKRNRMAVENIDAVEEIQDKALEPSEQLEQTQERKRIMQAIGQLNEEYRDIIVLRDLQGFSYQEIADLLLINLGTVKSRISRGRYQLRNILTQSDEKETSK